MAIKKHSKMLKKKSNIGSTCYNYFCYTFCF